jgi:hypothetical protein
MKLLHATLLVLPLLFLSGGASAEWIQFQDNKEFTGYAESAYSRSGKFLKVWVMRSYKSPIKTKEGSTYLTSKEQVEYDCTGGQSRWWHISYYPKAMGGGKPVDIVNINGGTEWVSLPPGSDGKTMQQSFCSLMK